MFRRFSAGVALALAGLVVAPALGGPARAAEPQGPLIPTAFKVPATNGYRAELLAGRRPEATIGTAILILSRRGASVTYATRAEVTETRIDARFGGLGEVDVHPVLTAGKVSERSDCGGKPLTFDSGRWEGTIRFRGEGGFSTVEASSGTAVVKPFLNLLCVAEIDEGIGGRSPGALLELRRRRSDERLELTVRKNKKVGPTRIGVDLSERRGDLSIDRSLSIVGPSKAFDFEIPPGRATVEPPEPFSGSLTLARGPGSSPRVEGDLRVDLPGRRAVPILGPGSIRASLVRAVLNPSHPF